MKYALVDEERVEAQPDLAGQCPICGQAMVAKCGETRCWHWAHRGRRSCDPWWENETAWHRRWKDHFPAEWQEVVHQSENGERHIADVKTDRGWVIEFQHSYLKPDERRSRDAFYRKLIWMVDGTRRKRDRAQLLKAWEEGVPVQQGAKVRTAFAASCVLLREWADSDGPVFLDLGEELHLVWMLARSGDSWAYLAPLPRAEFIESHRGEAMAGAAAFDAFVTDLPKMISEFESSQRIAAGAPPLRGFGAYLTRRSRGRRRL